MRCCIKKDLFNRWLVVHPDDELAWSGSLWVRHVQGLPAGLVQVSNFDTADAPAVYARLFGFEIINYQTLQ
jgi:hypothetical protein